MFFFPKGSEIYTVFAKDGDQGNPNSIHYSIINGMKDKTCQMKLFVVLMMDCFVLMVYRFLNN